jgi:hypothetical protein
MSLLPPRRAVSPAGFPRWGGALILAGLWAGAARAAEPTEVEALQPPTRMHLQTVQAAAQREGWAPQTGGLRRTAFRAYERDRLPAAEAWLDLARWSDLFGRSEDDFVAGWINAVNAAKVGHANLPTRFETRRRPLGARVSPDLQAWLLGTPAFATEFWAQLSPVDFVPRVFEILDELHRADPVRFKRYASLALAIALVYDVPPPPSWPHGQVSPTALPRKLPAPAEAFAWWTRQDAAGRTLHPLARLGADELKFVVDTPATFKELEWAQSIVDLPLAQLARAYTMVRYRKDRYANNQAYWPGRSYQLHEILGAGGICADQAYFATQIGKARAVPTLIFYGTGNDGRHAWFGFLGPGQKWQLDAGRYAEQRFVTGYARDPQTWGVLSDHELQFMAERFHALPSYLQSRLHAGFAAEYLAMGQGKAAGVAARKAVSFEKRNVRAWETLVAAARLEGRDARTVENLLREATLAFQLQPDLEAQFANRVAASLRARGETSAAEEEERRIARKNKSGRGDLSVRQAREALLRAIATQPLAGQLRAYQAAVDTYGRGAGIGFFDEVVVGFAEHLLQINQPAEALKAVDRARRTLRVEPHSQLAEEIDSLTKRIREAK